MTAHYLLKTEPSEYSFADLARDKETIWDGVSNPVGTAESAWHECRGQARDL